MPPWRPFEQEAQKTAHIHTHTYAHSRWYKHIFSISSIWGILFFKRKKTKRWNQVIWLVRYFTHHDVVFLSLQNAVQRRKVDIRFSYPNGNNERPIRSVRLALFMFLNEFAIKKIRNRMNFSIHALGQYM